MTTILDFVVIGLVVVALGVLAIGSTVLRLEADQHPAAPSAKPPVQLEFDFEPLPGERPQGLPKA